MDATILVVNRGTLMSELEKLSQDGTVRNSAEKACSKLFKPSHDCSKVKTVITDA